MDPLGNLRATAEEVIGFARLRGVGFECVDGHFHKNRRWIYLWRKDMLPGTGPADEPLGTLHYSLQGNISRLPNILQQSLSAFRGEWSEAGTLESIEEAYELVKGWLLEGREVDELPRRQARRWGI
jgi:hypothetical protein